MYSGESHLDGWIGRALGLSKKTQYKLESLSLSVQLRRAKDKAKKKAKAQAAANAAELKKIQDTNAAKTAAQVASIKSFAVAPSNFAAPSSPAFVSNPLAPSASVNYLPYVAAGVAVLGLLIWSRK